MTGCSHLNCWNKQHLKDLHWTENMKCNKAGSTMKIVTFIVLKDISELFYTFGDAKNQAGSDDLIDIFKGKLRNCY